MCLLENNESPIKTYKSAQNILKKDHDVLKALLRCNVDLTIPKDFLAELLYKASEYDKEKRNGKMQI